MSGQTVARRSFLGPVIKSLHSWGYSVKDCGTYSTEPVDFPDIAKRVCTEITARRAQRGIMVCGTGLGACIAANINSGHPGGARTGHALRATMRGTRQRECSLSGRLGDRTDFARRVHKLEEMDMRR